MVIVWWRDSLIHIIDDLMLLIVCCSSMRWSHNCRDSWSLDLGCDSRQCSRSNTGGHCSRCWSWSNTEYLGSSTDAGAVAAMKVCWSSNINGSIKELNDVDDTLPTIVEKQRHFCNKSWKQRHFSNKSWTTLFSKQFDHHWRTSPQKLSGKVYAIALAWWMLTCWPVVGGRCHAYHRCCWKCWTSMANFSKKALSMMHRSEYDAKNERRRLKQLPITRLT